MKDSVVTIMTKEHQRLLDSIVNYKNVSDAVYEMLDELDPSAENFSLEEAFIRTIMKYREKVLAL